MWLHSSRLLKMAVRAAAAAWCATAAVPRVDSPPHALAVAAHARVRAPRTGA